VTESAYTFLIELNTEDWHSAFTEKSSQKSDSWPYFNYSIARLDLQTLGDEFECFGIDEEVLTETSLGVKGARQFGQAVARNLMYVTN